MPETTKSQFTRLFAKALPKTSVGESRKVKNQERDYRGLHTFVLALKSVQALDTCVEEYLNLYGEYSPDDPRSKQIFVILVGSRLKLSPAGDSYPEDLKARLTDKQRPPNPMQSRFQSLDKSDQAAIYKALNNATLAGTVLDELRQAYLRNKGFPAKTFDDLYDFNPKPDAALEKQFRDVMNACEAAWGSTKVPKPSEKQCREVGCDAASQIVKAENWEKFKAAFQSFRDFVRQHGGDTLTLFQLLKWSWDPFHPRYVNGPRGRQRHQTPFGVLDVEHYLHIVIALLIRGANKKAGNVRGFTSEEYRFFFEPLAGTYFEPDYKDRFNIATSGKTNIQAFYDLAMAHLQLVLYAHSKNVTLVNATTKSGILGLYESAGQLAKTVKAPPPVERRSFVTQTPRLVAKQRFYMGDTMGVDEGQLRILYFEGDEFDPGPIYVEFLALPSVVFAINIGSFSRRVEDITALIVARDNKGLADLIKAFMELVIDFLVPEFGYVATFIERGIGGVLVEVAKQKAFDLALEAVSTTMAALGPGKTIGILAAAGALTRKGKLARLRLIKESAARLEKFERALLPKAKREFLVDAERHGGQLTTRELGDLGLHRQVDDKSTTQKLIERDRRAIDPGARESGEAAKVAPYVREVQGTTRAEAQEIRELTAHANRELVRDGRIPRDWSVEFPRTASNEAGIAQTRAIGRPGVAEDREIVFNLDKKTALRLGVKKQVKFDGFKRVTVWKIRDPRMMLLEHKEVMSVWTRTKFSKNGAINELVDMMKRHGNFLEELEKAAPNSWWLGVTYSGGGDARLLAVLGEALTRARQELSKEIGKRLLM